MYCIGFNGPPRSGKDSVAKRIDQMFDLKITPTYLKSLSMPMRLVGFAMLGLPYSVEAYEELKDQSHDVFGGETLRRFMIRYSEEFVKPAYGKAVWGKSLTNGLGTAIHLPGLCLIPDIGFQEETDHLMETFGPDRFLLVRLSRRGTDWTGDSRGYVEAEQAVNLWNVNNRLDHTADLVLTHCETLGWEL